MGHTANWWLRSSNSNNNAGNVNSGGTFNNNNATNNNMGVRPASLRAQECVDNAGKLQAGACTQEIAEWSAVHATEQRNRIPF
ncbi:MAG: DUF6273 domain-containing protein [Lachnospiraceae bacterium]